MLLAEPCTYLGTAAMRSTCLGRHDALGKHQFELPPLCEGSRARLNRVPSAAAGPGGGGGEYGSGVGA